MTRTADHALSLLTYVSKHPTERQTLERLANGAGIPIRTVRQLLDEVEYGCPEHRRPAMLEIVSQEHGFSYSICKGWRIRNGTGRILEATKDV